MAKIGITMGEPSGVGPEIIAKALESDLINQSDDEYIIYGDKAVFEHINTILNLKSNYMEKVKFVDLSIINEPIQFATLKTEYGRAAGKYIEIAIKDALNKKIDAIVTAPIHKKSFVLGGYGEKYAGHTEMLAGLTGTQSYCMMLASGKLRVCHVTTHVSLLDAITKYIHEDRILEVIKLADNVCRQLGIEDPSIGIAGINPHAGDNDLFGDEESRIIVPTLAKASKLGYKVDGPVPADTLFSKAVGGWYDIVLAMYHDQGHIPVKLAGFSYNNVDKSWSIRGINVTLGLPIIRTSVDHGTAFGKAGKGTADAESMIDAIKYANLLSE